MAAGSAVVAEVMGSVVGVIKLTPLVNPWDRLERRPKPTECRLVPSDLALAFFPPQERDPPAHFPTLKAPLSISQSKPQTDLFGLDRYLSACPGNLEKTPQLPAERIGLADRRWRSHGSRGGHGGEDQDNVRRRLRALEAATCSSSSCRPRMIRASSDSRGSAPVAARPVRMVLIRMGPVPAA